MDYRNGNRYHKNWILIGALALAMLFLGGVEASATNSRMNSFNSTYPSSPLTGNCSVCHTSVPNRNSYGAAYANAGHNFAYSQSLSASGGTTPYSWSVTSGNLPSGLSLSSGGTISGTPTSAGTSSFTVQVSGGGTATRSLSITIAAETPPPTGDLPTVTPPDGAVDVPITTAVIISANGSESLPPIDFILTESTPTFTVASDPGDDIMCVNGGVVRGSIAYDDFHTNATFTPDCPLANGMTYTATLTPQEDSQQSGFKEITWSFTTIVQTADTDQDGVEDGEDELPDDDTEATPPKSKGDGKFHVSVRKDGHRHLRKVRGISDTHFSINQERKPHGYEFRDGFVECEVHGISPGESVEVTIETPEEIPSGSKVFMSDAKGFSELPAVISGNRFTMTVTDGGNGDSDGQANGVIVDPVGVAVPTATGDGSTGVAPGAAGGGCSVVGSGGGWKESAGSYGLLTLVWLGLALRRRKPENGR